MKEKLDYFAQRGNVSPEELEPKIQLFPHVKDVVVSEQAGQIQAEVFLDKDMELEAEVKLQRDMMILNESLPNYKKIVRTVVRQQEFVKTTTRKIK